MKIVGLTGSFGCGKTTVAKMFEGLGAQTIDADEIVTELYRHKKVQKKLQKSFGKKIVSKHGKVKRNALAEIVFSDKIKLAKLNSLVHPLVLQEIKKKLKEFKEREKKLVVIDIPLLLESKEKFEYDFLVVVKCTKKVQLLRLQKKGFSLDQALARIYAQMPLQKKLEKADFVIDNSRDLQNTKKKVKKVFGKISGLK